jgi:hypothetical protein
MLNPEYGKKWPYWIAYILGDRGEEYIKMVFEWHISLRNKAKIQKELDDIRAAKKKVRTSEDGKELKEKEEEIELIFKKAAKEELNAALSLPNLPYTLSFMVFEHFLTLDRLEQDCVYSSIRSTIIELYPFTSVYSGA